MYARKDILYYQSIAQDRLREAELERIIRKSKKDNPNQSNAVFCAAIYKAGKQLEQWGRRLQKRYEPLLEHKGLA